MKKTILKSLLVLFILMIVIVVGGLSYVKFVLPNIEVRDDLQIEITSERVERGKYLANHVALCIDCHSTRDWNLFSGPPVPGTAGMGGEFFSRDVGMPGNYYAPNITPAGIGDWTDGELLRAITSGVNKEGKALFPIMPYPYYGKMDQEDIYSIIAYIRSLKPIEHTVPESEPDFPMSFIINLIPSKAEFQPNPPLTDKNGRGKVLANMCMECHTQTDKGQVIPDLAFSGGRPFILPTKGTVFSSNLTPDEETGIGRWTEEQFIQKFKVYKDSSFVPVHISTNTFNTVMPWEMLAGMQSEDLAAIYTYLMSLEPKVNKVEKFIASEE